MKRCKQYFTNGFEPRPYHIYVLGPHEATCNMFFGCFRDHINSSANTCGDKIDISNQDPQLPSIANSYTCIYKSRSPNECDITFTLTWDTTLLSYSGSFPSLPSIDAFIVLFRIENVTDFKAIQTRHIPRLVSLSEQHFDEIEKVLFLVGHRSQIYSTQQGFSAVEMQQLVATSHSTYRYTNLNNGESCADIIDRVIKELNAVHQKHYFITNRPTSSKDSTASMLAKIHQLIMGAIPLCTIMSTEDTGDQSSLSESQPLLNKS